MDEKLKILAWIIVNKSLKIQEGERVLIRYKHLDSKPLVKHILKEVYSKNAIPFIRYEDIELTALMREHYNEKFLNDIIIRNKFSTEQHDCEISIDYNLNDYEMKNINRDFFKKLHKTNIYRKITNTTKRWVLLRYPSALDAYKAGMKIEEFANFAINSMIIDYDELSKLALPLKKSLDKAQTVSILSPNTNLQFSINNINSVILAGEINLPDGEVYTAPVKNSVNGFIQFNTSTTYKGNSFKNIRLTFENGKIIQATCDGDVNKLNEIINTDSGSQFIGEFAFGFNPMIKQPIGDILFDEKILGSIHLALGQSYPNASNGNNSSIHWDLVQMLLPEYGGGKVFLTID